MFRGRLLKLGLTFIVTGLFVYACVEPFNPSIPASEIDILIIDGYINAGKGKTQIILSKASVLGESQEIKYEQNAQVSIESETNESFSLMEKQRGVYVIKLIFGHKWNKKQHGGNC